MVFSTLSMIIINLDPAKQFYNRIKDWINKNGYISYYEICINNIGHLSYDQPSIFLKDGPSYPFCPRKTPNFPFSFSSLS